MKDVKSQVICPGCRKPILEPEKARQPYPGSPLYHVTCDHAAQAAYIQEQIKRARKRRRRS